MSALVDKMASQRVSGEHTVARLQQALQRLPTPAVPRDLLVYVHVPFCTAKCTFCDWVKDIPGPQLAARGETQQRYVTALCEQMSFFGDALVKDYYRPRLVYWGGGTPTRLSAEGLQAVCQVLDATVLGEHIEEYTVECSPETATEDKLRVLRAYGANRLSIGAQSFDDEELKVAGRSHRAREIDQALESARRAEFRNVNLDLIVGFPGQERDRLLRSVRAATERAVEHVTLYVYRATAGTAMAHQLARGRSGMHRSEDLLDLYERARDVLISQGYSEYCTGYFCRHPSLICRADLYYYELEGDYIGFGAGAYSVLANHYLLNRSTSRAEFLQAPASHDVVERFSTGALRRLFGSLSPVVSTDRGMDFARFERLYGIAFDSIRDEPTVRGFLEYYQHCGAEFVEEDRRLRVTADTRTRAHVYAMANIAMVGEA